MSRYYREVAAHPAYEEGWAAYESGLPLSANPHKSHSYEASIAWETGWNHAESDGLLDEPTERESE